MKRSTKWLYIILIVIMAGFLVSYLLFAPEKDNMKILKFGMRLFVYLMILLGVFRRKIFPNKNLYEKTYKDILRGVFDGDKNHYSMLMKAIAYYNQDEFRSAHQLLDVLECDCKQSREYIAVYMFQALSFEEEGELEQAIDYYKRILDYDMTKSDVWSNMGLCYRKLDMVDEAYEAYSNAIRFDPGNAMAYNNMAHFFIYLDEMEQALPHCLKALELDNKLYQAMGGAAMAYAALGDEEESERYCKLYGQNGGNERVLRDKIVERRG